MQLRMRPWNLCSTNMYVGSCRLQLAVKCDAMFSAGLLDQLPWVVLLPWTSGLIHTQRDGWRAYHDYSCPLARLIRATRIIPSKSEILYKSRTTPWPVFSQNAPMTAKQDFL
jgi:hypothetical protein